MKAHQDENIAYQYLSRPYKLNFILDDHAKNIIWGLEGLHLPSQEIFLLDPVAVFVGVLKDDIQYR